MKVISSAHSLLINFCFSQRLFSVTINQIKKQPATGSSSVTHTSNTSNQQQLAAPEPGHTSSTSSSCSSQSNCTNTQYSTSTKSKGDREEAGAHLPDRDENEPRRRGVNDRCVDGLLGWMDSGARARRSRLSWRPALPLPRTTATVLWTIMLALVASSVPPAPDREPRRQGVVTLRGM